jgi:hypothetical protein
MVNKLDVKTVKDLENYITGTLTLYPVVRLTKFLIMWQLVGGTNFQLVRLDMKPSEKTISLSC